jgi:SAM-dependent methyltransferase
MKEYWDLHARRDPLWAVLSDDAKKHRGWTLQAFMATGEREMSLLFYQLAELGIHVRRGKALDFGCGVGRLTQAMARRFNRVVGLDISPRMIEIARQLNQYHGHVDYLVHDTPDLSTFDVPFDFIYSNVVLQHIPAGLTAQYLRAFCGALNPDGLLVFQLPSHRAEKAARVPGPMADSAYRAAISVAGEPLAVLPPSSEGRIGIGIRNTSETPWLQEAVGAIRAGNHWLSPSGEMLIQDDGRVSLPGTLAAGELHVAEMVVKTPPPGQYILEFDAVHEGVTWFGDRGSPTLRIPVLVGAAEASDAPADSSAAQVQYDERQLADTLEPLEGIPAPEEFPMNAIERREVERIIGNAGGRIIRVEEDDRAKPEWVGYQYFVTCSNRP